MNKLIVGISGSPKSLGNNVNILERALLHLSELDYDTELIKISDYNIGPCIACNYCKKEKKCIQKDDGNKMTAILEKADAILVSSPVYFGSMSGQLKCLLDRTLPLRRNGFLLKGKIGAAIGVGGSRSGGQELTIKDIHAWMLIHGMVLVGDNNHFGGTVQVPYGNDDFGEETIEGTIQALDEILKRLK